MLAPFDAGRLIELEFVFQIFARVACDSHPLIVPRPPPSSHSKRT
jgi:hypothetical protein